MALFYLDTPDPTETSKMAMEVKTIRARAFIVSQGMNDNGLPAKIISRPRNTGLCEKDER